MCRNCGEENPERARFCWNCGRPLAAETLSAETRKTVTVLFCDVAGSTAIGEQADPETLRRVMARYFDAIRTAVERHGGTVEKFIGDAAMAVFGVPTVHEDDALRAIRAAIDIRDALAELAAGIEREQGIAIAWRTGINTGEVVAGDAGAGQTFVTGDAVNVAARLEQAAQPGQTLIGEATRELVRDAARLETVRPIDAKGKSEPLRAFLLVGLAAEAEPRAEGSRRLVEAPMVGRDRPRRLLADAWEEVVASSVCHLFTVLGAPGVGKSRLVREFIDGLGTEVMVLRGRCLSYGDGITYWPVAEVVRQAAGLVESDDRPAALEKLGALFEADADRPQATARLAELIGLEAGTAAQDELFWAVRRMLQSLAERQPLVLVLDDLHWAEPTLLDLVDHLSDWITDAPLLIVCLARRELLDIRPGWGGGKAHATTITLEPLTADESRELAGTLLGVVEMGEQLVERIGAAADGNPLFVEEMIRMLIDRGELAFEGGRCVAVGDISHVAVPPTIQALLAARIDGLEGSERAVLERASVEGQVFHRAAVVELAPAELRDGVAQRIMVLTRKELVRPEREETAALPGDEAFRFRHMLIRDAAYGAIPKQTRAELHARFAGWLSRMAGNRLVEYEEILGYHYEEAYRYRTELGAPTDETRRLADLAAHHLGASGRRALDHGDVEAARKLFSRALAIVPEDDPMVVRLRAELGRALTDAGELRAADEMLIAAADQAQVMGDELGAAYAELYRLDVAGMVSAQRVEEGLGRVEALLPIFERHGDERGLDLATFEWARHQFFAGRARQAEEIVSQRIAGGAGDAALFGLLPSLLAWGPTPVDEAERKIASILHAAGNRETAAEASGGLGLLRALKGDFATAREMVGRSVDIREGLGQHVRAHVQRGLMLGNVELRAGNIDEAARILRESTDALEKLGERAFASTVVSVLASVEFLRGNVELAAETATKARGMAAPDDFATHSQALRVEGRVLAMRGEFKLAEDRTREAVAMLDETDYLTERGEAYADLAEVLAAAGDARQAVEALRTALDLFQTKGAIVLAEKARQRLAEIEQGIGPGGARS